MIEHPPFTDEQAIEAYDRAASARYGAEPPLAALKTVGRELLSLQHEIDVLKAKLSIARNGLEACCDCGSDYRLGGGVAHSTHCRVRTVLRDSAIIGSNPASR